MNYPLWGIPAPGLLIAFVAIVHVFVSHFAVGGGLFLVVSEMKARRGNDGEWLAYLHRLSRFFVLLTLVFGAVTGVGIWFTIALVHPAATSSLISAFVWGWAIEWTLFLTEIAAALVYYYGWERLTPRQHVTVGWIYFVAAWGSLFVINGILTFMLTPGRWLETRSFLDGFFNPTFWPSLVIRTAGALGLAGVYALFTASWMATPELKGRLVRYAAIGWVLPMAVILPFATLWFLGRASLAGVPVAEIFAARTAGPIDLFRSMFATATIGYPVAQRALRTAFASVTVLLAIVAFILLFRRLRFGPFAGALAMLAALCSIGAFEWVREDLRKPYVIGSYMFVNGVRLPASSPSANPRYRNDAFAVERVTAAGALASARWARVIPYEAQKAPTVEEEKAEGREVFRVLCRQCHTVDGYLAVRPLVMGRSSAVLENLIGRLAVPRAAGGMRAEWSTPGVQMTSWRGRRMPPFAGNDREKRALSVYLASLGGGAIAAPPAQASAAGSAESGKAVFEERCEVCHGPGTDWPMAPRVAGRSAAELYAVIGDLPNRNAAMLPFDGTDAERRALVAYLQQLAEKEEK